MDFSHYSDEPVQMAVALINSIDVVTGDDKLQTPEDVGTFIDAWGDNWFDVSCLGLEAHDGRVVPGDTRDADGGQPPRHRLAGLYGGSWIERTDVIVTDRTVCRFETRLLRCIE